LDNRGRIRGERRKKSLKTVEDHRGRETGGKKAGRDGTQLDAGFLASGKRKIGESRGWLTIKKTPQKGKRRKEAKGQCGSRDLVIGNGEKEKRRRDPESLIDKGPTIQVQKDCSSRKREGWPEKKEGEKRSPQLVKGGANHIYNAKVDRNWNGA